MAAAAAPQVRITSEEAAQSLFGADPAISAVLRATVSPHTTADTEAASTAALDTLLADLAPISAAAALFARAGTRLDFEGRRLASVTLPTIDANMVSTWIEEADPIPVQVPDLGSTSIAPRKLASISVLTEELLRRSNAQASTELLFRIAAATALDTAMFDAGAASTARPAGLRNGVTPIAGMPGGDMVALQADLTAIISALSAISSDIAIVMHPTRALALQIMAPALTVPILQTSHITPTTIIGIALPALVVGGGTLEIDAARHVTVHMSDTPGEIVPDGGAVSDPIRSTWQTATVALRSIMEVTWGLRAPGVATVEGVSW